VQLGILTRDLDKLADKDLFAIARDRRAANRAEAIRLLVQRCSAFIRRPEISDEVEALLATPPLGATD
jgi:hypothetical protein